jgi:hypothetical protein
MTLQVRIWPSLISAHLRARAHHQHAFLCVAGCLGHLPSRLNVPVSTCAPLSGDWCRGSRRQAGLVDELEKSEPAAEVVAILSVFYAEAAAIPTAGKITYVRCCAFVVPTAAMPITADHQRSSPPAIVLTALLFIIVGAVAVLAAVGRSAPAVRGGGPCPWGTLAAATPPPALLSGAAGLCVAREPSAAQRSLAP